MMYRIGLIISTLAVCVFGGRYKAPDPSEVNFHYNKIPTLEELVTDAGYELDPHRVTTEDGHILALHRITPRGTNSRDRGYPVLMINGFAFQAEGWFALGSASLPFILTDLGYDVWLGDQRGNIRSVGHVSYPVNDWRNHNYTFHEQGIYDLPAFIDYILKETDRSQILYVGYSLSSGMMIVMNSERPEYNDKILGAVLLAPAGHLKKWNENSFDYLAGLMVTDAMIESQIQNGQWLLFGQYNLVKDSIAGCSFLGLNPICRLMIFNMYGVSDVMDPKTMFYQFAMTVTSASVYVGKHLLQTIKNGRFCKFDYGPEKNVQVYGNKLPPQYDFGRTRIPVYLFHSGTDKMVTPDAARRTGKSLGNLVKMKFIERFNHADYLFGRTAPKFVYENIVDYFDELVTTTLD
uniref:Lipase n=2 Tax=Lygus hesperus TaxID=30085 RepID=A0A146M9I5_LYGHE